MDQETAKYELYENHLDLVYWTINTYFPEYKYDEDFFQEACIALIKAIKIDKPEKGYKFSTLAVRCIKYRCVNEIKRRQRKKNYIDAISLNCIEKDSGKELIDMLANNSTNFENALLDNIYTKQLIKELKKKLSDMDKLILEMRNKNKSYSEIGNYVGLSSSSVCCRIKVIRQAYIEVIQEMGTDDETRQESNKSTENQNQKIRS